MYFFYFYLLSLFAVSFIVIFTHCSLTFSEKKKKLFWCCPISFVSEPGPWCRRSKFRKKFSGIHRRESPYCQTQRPCDIGLSFLLPSWLLLCNLGSFPPFSSHFSAYLYPNDSPPRREQHPWHLRSTGVGPGLEQVLSQGVSSDSSGAASVLSVTG